MSWQAHERRVGVGPLASSIGLDAALVTANYGRGGGVGRDLGVGVTRGPAVGVAVTVAVGVGVGAGKQKNSIELSGVPSLPYPPANHM